MEINILQLLPGAAQARGITVVIDVFRAFTTACTMAANGAARIVPIADLALARQIKKENPDCLLAGERNEEKPPDFDFGNSPALLEHVDLSGCTILHTTSAGTQGIAAAANAAEILTGSFSNAPAIVRYIKKQNPSQVSFVCMGKAACAEAEEDTYCAEYMESLLTDTPYPLKDRLNSLRHLEGRRFFIPSHQIHCPERDFYLATQVGLYPFVLRAVPWDAYPGLVQLEKYIP